MIPKIWRLSQTNDDDNLGLVCTEQGLLLGRTPLIEWRDGRFIVRERAELERLLGRAYRRELAITRLMPGLATVASALNANDQGLRGSPRCICGSLICVTVPRNEMEAEDALINYVRQRELTYEFRKASPDDP
jgi:hypothetical protein